ncbi:hypothetical protein NM208_g12326 [Fusarium decemcellulare]|uniref:Uncharacterized protein n=1 Tax=Fusarium decemcellulare TaxID=57161 RepID=A0ACC1RP28_9HYPO|nr:hypothetical protein NM208_g12326 [Fusarium decemcellulare]
MADHELCHHQKPGSNGEGFSSQKTFFTICDFLGAPLVYHWVVKLLGMKPLVEEPKVVMHRWKKRELVLRNLVHILPFGAALALVLLNTISLYIGGEMSGVPGRTTETFFALLITAKVHELLMVTSLTTIVATHIRKELIFGDGLPYGAIFAPHRFNTIGFIFSGAFSGLCFQKWQAKARKHFLIWLIIICAMLSVWVGPASVILMRPRAGEYDAGGTWFWINST